MERFERRKLFLGMGILGICQDHDVNCTSLVLQRKRESERERERVKVCERVFVKEQRAKSKEQGSRIKDQGSRSKELRAES